MWLGGGCYLLLVAAVAVVAIAAEQSGSVAVKRVCSPDIPVPFAPGLEDAYIPGVEQVVAAARAVCGELQSEGVVNA